MMGLSEETNRFIGQPFLSVLFFKGGISLSFCKPLPLLQPISQPLGRTKKNARLKSANRATKHANMQGGPRNYSFTAPAVMPSMNWRCMNR